MTCDNRRPRPFGFPAWQGRVKRRVAKKVINGRGRDLLQRYAQFNAHGVGSLVRACDGLNSRVVSVDPVWKTLKHGRVLFDLDIQTDKTSCSFYHCGVEPACSHEEAVAYKDAIVKRWANTDDPYGFAKRYATMTIYADGTYEESP